MGNKQNARRRTRATGTWKCKKITENTDPGNLEAPKVVPTQPWPRARPAYGKAKAGKHADKGEEHGKCDSSVAEAAEALLSMQDAPEQDAGARPKSPMELTQAFDELGGVGSADEPKDEDGNTNSSDGPKETELLGDDYDYRIGSVPVESPKKKLDKFDIPFEVPFKNVTRDMEGITSYTTFDTFLESLADKMETCLSLLSSIAY
ncbi:hypothetical protein BJV78DRAFT_1159396, partial [Lactifluus subvellereus]